MVNKSKRIFAVALCVSIVAVSISAHAAIIADNDASAFITKAEFASLKSAFNSQLNGYLNTVDAKIDYTIANYLNNFSSSAGVINNYNLLSGLPRVNGEGPIANLDGTDDPPSGDWTSMELGIWAPNTYAKNGAGASPDADHFVLSAGNDVKTSYPQWSSYKLPASLTNYGVWDSQTAINGISQEAATDKGQIFITDTSGKPMWLSAGGLGSILYNDVANNPTWLAAKTDKGYYYLNADVTTAAVAPAWVAALDSSSAAALSTARKLVTERDVYYGLPTINGDHTYDASKYFYMLTTPGTANQYWRADASTQGAWHDGGTIASGGTDYLAKSDTIYDYNQLWCKGKSQTNATKAGETGIRCDAVFYTQVGPLVVVCGWFQIDASLHKGACIAKGLPATLTGTQCWLQTVPYSGGAGWYQENMCTFVDNNGNVCIRNDNNGWGVTTGFTFYGYYFTGTPYMP